MVKIMVDRITFEERFEKFKDRIGRDHINNFLADAEEFYEIRQGLIKEKMENLKDG